MTVLLLRQDREKLYRELTYIDAKLRAAEALINSKDMDEEIQASLSKDHERLAGLWLEKVNEIKALDIYGSFYAGRLLKSVSAETATTH